MTKLKTTPSTQPALLESKDQEIAALKDRLARALADYQNLESRYSRENENLIKYANSNLIEKLLEVRDHLGLAATTGDKSLGLILSTLDKILVDQGVTTINTSGSFDPNFMECADTVIGEAGQVVSTIRPGYMLHQRVLRPARVTVGNDKQISH